MRLVVLPLVLFNQLLNDIHVLHDRLDKRIRVALILNQLLRAWLVAMRQNLDGFLRFPVHLYLSKGCHGSGDMRASGDAYG